MTIGYTTTFDHSQCVNRKNGKENEKTIFFYSLHFMNEKKKKKL